VRKEKLYATEADLCAAFIKYHEARGLVAYAETAGFDILLVRSDGVQFGVQAKQSLNTKVLDQLLPSDYQDEGPDHRVILVPENRGIVRICEALGDEPVRVKRIEVKSHICHSAKANDANIRQALIDRYNGKDAAIGKKAKPGPLYGVSGDMWAALAVGLTVLDRQTMTIGRAA
jgi:hypothetical protein